MNLIGLAGLLAACADVAPGPQLEAARPPSSSHGETVLLVGSRLCGSHRDCLTAAGEIVIGIDLPAIQAVVISYADTQVQIVVPDLAPIGKTQILLTVNDRTSNALAFEVLP